MITMEDIGIAEEIVQFLKNNEKPVSELVLCEKFGKNIDVLNKVKPSFVKKVSNFYVYDNKHCDYERNENNNKIKNIDIGFVKSICRELIKNGKRKWVSVEQLAEKFNTDIKKIIQLEDVFNELPKILKIDKINHKYQYIGNVFEVELLDYQLMPLNLSYKELKQIPGTLLTKGVRVKFNNEDNTIIDTRILLQFKEGKVKSKSGIGRLLTKKSELGFVGRTYIMKRVDILLERQMLETFIIGKTETRENMRPTSKGNEFLNKNKHLLEDALY